MRSAEVEVFGSGRMVGMLSLACVLALGACKVGDGKADGEETGDTPNPNDLLGIGLSPNGPIVGVGEQISFVAKAFYADTSYRVVTGDMSWQSTDPRVASVDANGVALGLGEGKADIIATDGSGVSTKVQLTVKAGGVVPTGLQLSPASLTLRIGESLEVTALASYPDGTSGNVSSNCTFSTDASSTASVNGAEVKGVAVGSTTLRAACNNGLSGTAGVTVTQNGGGSSGQPDIIVTDMVAYLSGSDIEVIAEVKNQGNANASGFYLDAFLDLNSAPTYGTDFDGTTWVSGLAPGQSQVVLLDISDVGPGLHPVWVLADADQFVAESNESNNAWGIAYVSVAEEGSGPDLRIVSFEGLSDGFYTTYEIVIENEGDEAAWDFFVDLWWDRFSDPDVCEYGDDYAYVDVLFPGERATFYSDIDDGPFSSWDSVVFVDSCDEVAENDESDNMAYTTVYGF